MLSGRFIFGSLVFIAAIAMIFNIQFHVDLPLIVTFFEKSNKHLQRFNKTLQRCNLNILAQNTSLLGKCYQMKQFCQLYDSFHAQYIQGNGTNHHNCSGILNNTKMETVQLTYDIHNNLERALTVKQLQEENFTVVIPTYKRMKHLFLLIKVMNGTSNLDKIIVIWNDLDLPSDDVKWPKIDIRVQVISNGINSLNNKNLPLPHIRTEAVFLIDDDVAIEQKEMLSAFRVWQINRENLVGFYQRTVWYDSKKDLFSYTFQPRKYLSVHPLVLAGACLVSKYYFFMYSFEMPQEIRDFVDENMNGEDLALAFLVAHNIHKHPIVVHDKSIQQRPSEGLSLRSEHGRQRNKCINMLYKVYGYMPLVERS